jgi:hypothetical protein
VLPRLQLQQREAVPALCSTQQRLGRRCWRCMLPRDQRLGASGVARVAQQLQQQHVDGVQQQQPLPLPHGAQVGSDGRLGLLRGGLHLCQVHCQLPLLLLLLLLGCGGCCGQPQLQAVVH